MTALHRSLPDHPVGIPRRTMLVVLAATACLAAQSPLTTLFASNNSGSAGGTVLFDLAVNTPITITRIDVNSDSPVGTPGTLEILVTPGSYIGNELSPGAWTTVSAGNLLTTAPKDTPTMCVLTRQFGLPVGSVGVMLKADTWKHAYTNGAVPAPGTQFFTTELTGSFGAAQNAPFTFSFTPRVANIEIHYSIGGSPSALVQFGAGCGATHRPLTLVGTGMPLVGSSTGLHTVFTGNALIAANILSLIRNLPPIPLASIGMAGCNQYVGTDAVQILPTPSNGTASTSFSIPNDPGFAGLRVHSQSVALDSGHNLLGATTSNGLTLRLGIGGVTTPQLDEHLLFDPMLDFSALVEASPGQPIPFDVYDLGSWGQPHTVTWSTTSPNVTVTPPTSIVSFGAPTRHTLQLQTTGLATPASFSVLADVNGPVFIETTSQDVTITPGHGIPQCVVQVSINGGPPQLLSTNVVEISDDRGPGWEQVVLRTGPGSIRVNLYLDSAPQPWVADLSCSVGCPAPQLCTGTAMWLAGLPVTLQLTCTCQ